MLTWSSCRYVVSVLFATLSKLVLRLQMFDVYVLERIFGLSIFKPRRVCCWFVVLLCVVCLRFMFLFCTNNFENIFVATKLYFIKVTSGQGQTMVWGAVFDVHNFQKSTVAWRTSVHIKPHCSGIRRLRMLVFKNDPYLTCTPPYKLGATVANCTFSVRFNDGLGWDSVSGNFGEGERVLDLRSAYCRRSPGVLSLSRTVRGFGVCEWWFSKTTLTWHVPHPTN